MDMNEAAEALAAANNAGEPMTPPATPAPEAAAPASPTSADQPATGSTPEESFAPGVDPASLPPEMQAIYKSMQGHFTRATQALAEKSKALDGLNIDEARQAVDFVNALNSDPNYAMQVHQALTEALQAQGMSLGEASTAAAEALTEPDDSFGNELPPEILQRLERLEQFEQNQQMLYQQNQLEAELVRLEAQIQQQHPDWDQSDMDWVYSEAYKNGGDLLRAADSYVDLQARLATRLINSKGSIPHSNPASAGHAQAPPEVPQTLDAATDAAKEAFLRSFEA